MNLHLMFAFWGLVLLLIIVPGPDWAFILASGTRDHTVLPAVAGLMIGYSLLTLLVAAGVGALVAGWPLFLTVLTTVGAAYLIVLGVTLLRRPGSLHADPGSAPSRPLLRGIGVSGLNPKGLLIFVAMLPQFTDAAASWPISLQLATLGLIFVITCGAFYTAVGYGTRAVLGVRPRASRLISRLSGAAMIIVGILLITERLSA